MIEVLQPGLFSSVQDLGRQGWRQLGFARSGAMDPVAASAANALLNQDPNCATIECTLIGPSLKFHCDSAVAVTGATMTILVDDVPHQVGQTIAIAAGQTLKLGRAAHGCRSYLAIKGGLQLPKVLGSASFQSQVGLGLQLQRQQQLPITPYRGVVPHCHSWIGLIWTITPVLAVFAAPHSNRIHGGLDSLCSQPWQLSQHANRIGLRLTGAPLAHDGIDDLRSEPVLPGTVQLPANGVPLLLGADAQAVGGYLKIGQISHSSFSTMAQLRPHQQLWFEAISLPQAQQRQHRQQRQLQMLALRASELWQ
ncbi:biotin-dependent carboxyltransferase family protein [uncultured Ferrimonas sp.]|uniref:5-oxoprolinase subunit C family protein n=1 Tax=uncultured Ferrimonas sp. TaxID=432640 RepID=UPI002602AD31|nr:biotin-dependent carboxyltransferase family protein [uncultured Ferrimonas sp.]